MKAIRLRQAEVSWDNLPSREAAAGVVSGIVRGVPSGDASPARAAEVDERIRAFAAALLQCRIESELGPCTGGLRLAQRGGRLHRMREQEALHADRAAVGEKFQLRGALDAFGHDLQSQSVAQG